MPSKSAKANKRRKLAIDAQGPDVEMPQIGIKDEQELALETLLFGGDNLDDIFGAGKEAEEQVFEEEAEAEEEINFGFVIDTVGTTKTSSPESEETEEKNDDGAAWIDEETEKISVNIANSHSRLKKLRKDEAETNISGQEYESRLRSQFEKINPVPSWAASTEEDEDEDDDGLAFLKNSSGASRDTKLPFTCESLEIHRMTDANKAEPCQVYRFISV
jgi:hypothetical protein